MVDSDRTPFHDGKHWKFCSAIQCRVCVDSGPIPCPAVVIPITKP
jgi:hypothetical protein